MRKRKIIAILGGTILSVGLLTGCSGKSEVHIESTNNNINSNQSNTDKTVTEQGSSKLELNITDIKVSEDVFTGEDLSINIEDVRAQYIAFIGKYDVWVPEDESFLYVSNSESKDIVQKLSLSGNKVKPKGSKVLGAEDYGSFYCVPYLGEIFYVNSLDELVVIDLNGENPKVSLVDIDFSVNYIAGTFVSVDEANKRELYVVSTEGELYRIDYVDAEQDGSGVYKLDGYDNVKFSDILKDRDSSKVSIRLEGDYADSPTLVIRKLDGESKVENTVIDVNYDEYYSEVSLSLK